MAQRQPFIRLDGDRSSYVIDVSGQGMPLCRYWGRRLPPGTDLAALPLLLERPLPQGRSRSRYYVSAAARIRVSVGSEWPV